MFLCVFVRRPPRTYTYYYYYSHRVRRVQSIIIPLNGYRRCSKMLPFTRCDFDVSTNFCGGGIYSIHCVQLVSIYIYYMYNKRRARNTRSCDIYIINHQHTYYVYNIEYIYIYVQLRWCIIIIEHGGRGWSEHNFRRTLWDLQLAVYEKVFSFQKRKYDWLKAELLQGNGCACFG